MGIFPYNKRTIQSKKPFVGNRSNQTFIKGIRPNFKVKENYMFYRKDGKPSKYYFTCGYMVKYCKDNSEICPKSAANFGKRFKIAPGLFKFDVKCSRCYEPPLRDVRGFNPRTNAKPRAPGWRVDN